MTVTDDIDRHIDRNIDDYLAELSELCSIPSVSSSGADLRPCARTVEAMLARRGFTVRTFETAGPPIVFAETGTGPRSILFYNHYDVQPPEPLALWTSPPFSPAVRDGALFARGAIDDKGEFVSRLAAIDAYRAAHAGESICLKIVVEGAEEVGSPGMREFLDENAELLAADVCIWEAGGVDASNRPLISLGLRGMLFVELRAHTMTRDAHSGDAHALPNAAWRLAWALASLKDHDERVKIAGFYDAVLEPASPVRAFLERMPSPAPAWRTQLGVREFAGGRADDALSAAVFSPTCNICGITAGYDGPGMKTVIPSQASCKIDFRLVPDQEPGEIARQLRSHLDRNGFADIELAVSDGAEPSLTDPTHPFVGIAVDAARDAWRSEPVVVPMVGGSGPMAWFAKRLKLPVVSVGCSYPGARKHAPDEHIRIGDFASGAKHVARILAALSSNDST